mmetsp:Transcript_10292/g.41650  ORF Transcript_10292/g.41650 Transcript_10292/m.41650 type:complete len:229 (+) Transcript_10292:372-1058(+)
MGSPTSSSGPLASTIGSSTGLPSTPMPTIDGPPARRLGSMPASRAAAVVRMVTEAPESTMPTNGWRAPSSCPPATRTNSSEPSYTAGISTRPAALAAATPSPGRHSRNRFAAQSTSRSNNRTNSRPSMPVTSCCGSMCSMGKSAMAAWRGGSATPPTLAPLSSTTSYSFVAPADVPSTRVAARSSCGSRWRSAGVTSSRLSPVSRRNSSVLVAVVAPSRSGNSSGTST